MKISSARYLQSAEHEDHYPSLDVPEIAFAGRSNVGKSSAINTLLGRRNLVRTSKTPGHTRKLNFYLINDSFIFTDLPGYGFARVPMEMKKRWGPMVETYLTADRDLRGVVLIADVRHGLTESDLALVEFLRFHEKTIITAAVKADKLPRGKQAAHKRTMERTIGPDVPVTLFSSLDGTGKKELWKEIKRLID